MPNVFVVKPIVPGKYDTTRVMGNIIRALQDEGRDTLLPVYQTVQNWSDPPVMGYKVTQTANMAMVETGPKDKNSHQGKKWFWLAYGTRVRYADLSRDWQSKTSPGSIQSGRGAGRVLARGRYAKRHAGIVARGWVPIIEKMRRKPFRTRIQMAIATGLRVRS